MKRLLDGALIGGAIVIVLIALTHIALGQTWIPGTVPVTPSLDSEHRFYTSLFLMYGVALGWVSRDLDARRGVLQFLLLTLFVGGLARIASLIATGWPHPLFIVLGVVELLLPPLLWRASVQLGGPSASSSTTVMQTEFANTNDGGTPNA